MLGLGAPALADTLRIATYHTELERDGPGLLLRDILKGEDPQLIALRQVITITNPDILVLQGVDYDHGLVTLTALRDWLSEEGPDYPHLFARAPNTGVDSGIDLDGDGRLGGPRDAQGFGQFFGQGGMAILSRHPIDAEHAKEFTELLWRDLPGARLPMIDGQPFPSLEALAVQRLSSVAHWVVPVMVNDTPLHVMSFHATPPVFDGPEDRNGRRNHDELLFWTHYLDGHFGPAPDRRYVIAGVGNLDPVDGEGLKPAITTLLDDPRLQDASPMRPDGPLQDSADQTGNPRLDTVAWAGPVPGHLRVSYILPSADLQVEGAGVYWPAPGDAMAAIAEAASRHRLVWVDVTLK